MHDDEIDASLSQLFNQGLISEVLNVVRSGKEATVYCCRGINRDLLAVKAYRALRSRGFRDDAVYQPGRTAAMRRQDRLAFEKKSAHGLKLRFASWIRSEYETMSMLYAAGADVPEPYACAASALVMEYIGDLGGPAPMLSQVEVEPREARELFARLVRNLALWLRLDRVHGDLSPYNVLYFKGRVRVIDFPQAVDPRMNPNARALLERDLENLCRYFFKMGVDADPHLLARDLWRRYQHARL